mmetsp:Transcript_15233/g.21190  ORF Transcript_15233/g.21190 Transcript_15233/m.21190 type:complete len:210 (+) Transcript_15233:105-734(+)|eukprot:CAMPEP_0185262080 /NCGR_PEP_ID=MMETSP1359-20130426/10319_1 /TAXON_ID=552665 /ORGANISM="Bigelowiella longifila, Strain CCMP242" /LENGTH=209 /DNA_ID=CAMNT_0027848907 /DNA_START=58 /DNA_END=687 /DNA_ORIENTATION=-
MGGTISLTDKLFNAIDVDKSGYLTRDELQDWFGHRIPNLTDDDKESMLRAFEDQKEIGREDFANFFKSWTGNQLESASVTIVRLSHMEKEVLDILHEMDENDDGLLERNELNAILNPSGRLGNYTKQIRGLFRLLDKDASGYIQVEAMGKEFLRHYKLASKSRSICPCLFCEHVYDTIYKRRQNSACCGMCTGLKYMEAAQVNHLKAHK